MDQGYHQIHSDISLPTKRDLLLKVVTMKQVVAVANEIGREKLAVLAAVKHDGKCTDFAAAEKQEASDLETVRLAVFKVLGIKRPWIIGYASEFAQCLLSFI